MVGKRLWVRVAGSTAALALAAGLSGFTLFAFAQGSLDQEIEELGLDIGKPEIKFDTPRVPATPIPFPDKSAEQGGVVQAVTGVVSPELTSPQADLRIDNQIRVLLRPRRTTLLSTKTSGQISSLPFDIGDQFGEGDTLIKLGCSGTYSEIAIAKSRVNQSQIEYESNRNLLVQGGVSRFDVELSAARVEETKAVLNKYQVEAGDCILKAPYAGKVVARLVERFEYVGSGQQVLEIIDDSKLNMQLYVPSLWIAKLEKGAEFKVHIEEVGRDYGAKVIRVNPRVDAGSKTLEIIAEMAEQHDELRAGMSGNAEFDFED